MNTSNMAGAAPYILGQDWVDVIHDALLAQASGAPLGVEPEVMAGFDVMMGRHMAPESYYRTVAECEAYILAYREMVGMWAERVEHINADTRVHILSEAECAQLADEYEDDMADREYHSRGEW